jgi:hypothetical protein
MSNAAIWGDSGVASSFGVVGTVDVGNAFWGKNNDTVNKTLYLENYAHVTNGVAPVAARFAGPGRAPTVTSEGTSATTERATWCAPAPPSLSLVIVRRRRR